MTKAEKLDAAFEAFRNVVEFMGNDAHCELNACGSNLELTIYCHPKHQDNLHTIRRLAGLSEIRKTHYKADSDGSPWTKWHGETEYGKSTLSLFDFCEIIGYEDKVVPAQPAQPERTVTKAIYKCT